MYRALTRRLTECRELVLDRIRNYDVRSALTEHFSCHSMGPHLLHRVKFPQGFAEMKRFRVETVVPVNWLNRTSALVSNLGLARCGRAWMEISQQNHTNQELHLRVNIDLYRSTRSLQWREMRTVLNGSRHLMRQREQRATDHSSNACTGQVIRGRP